MQNRLLPNPHAGDILKYEFLEELNLSEGDLAVAIGVPDAIIEDIVQGKSGMTADIDLRLSRYFGLSEGYFLRLQNTYELMEIMDEISREAVANGLTPEILRSILEDN